MPRTSNKGDEILKFITKQIQQKGFPPSIREICEAVGLKSTSSVHAHLVKLAKEGKITKYDSKTRALTVTDSEKKNTPSGKVMNFQSKYLEVPVIGRVTAGQPILAVEEFTDTFPLPMEFAKNKDLFILTVRGDSMINAAILDGDLVIVQKQQNANNGDIVVALIDDSATVKTFYKEKGHYRLQPENDFLEPIIVNDLSILGKVVGVFRKL